MEENKLRKTGRKKKKNMEKATKAKEGRKIIETLSGNP
jgi:hypothetical protein